MKSIRKKPEVKPLRKKRTKKVLGPLDTEEGRLKYTYAQVVNLNEVRRRILLKEALRKNEIQGSEELNQVLEMMSSRLKEEGF